MVDYTTDYIPNSFDPPKSPTKFWLEDPGVLFRDGNYYVIIPTAKMNKIEVLNALTRFFLYVLILYLLFSVDREYLYVPIIALIVILSLYFMQRSQEPVVDKFSKVDLPDNNLILESDGSTCQGPTPGNPFMNVTTADLMNRRNRPGACPVTDPIIRQEMNYNFNRNVLSDVEDVFDRNHSARQFYTMPSTTIPNNQTEFAKWLYKAPETCKENQLNCLKYEDIRFNRFSPNIDRMVKNEDDLE